MRLNELSAVHYKERIKRVKQKLEEKNLDAFIGYGSECESGTIRYLTGFWPFFDFASVIIPKEGNPVLLTGGPESLDFAEVFSKIKNI